MHTDIQTCIHKNEYLTICTFFFRLGSINLGTQRFTANDSVVAAAEGQVIVIRKSLILHSYIHTYMGIKEFDVRDGHHNSSEKYAGLTPQYTHR